MRKIKFISIFVILSIQNILISGNARYDNYHLFNVHLASEAHVKLLQDLEANSDSVLFYGHARHPEQNLTIMVAAHKVADFEDLLATYKFEHRILTRNFQEKIDKNLQEVQPMSIDPKDLDWQHYFHLETINAWLRLQSQKHANVLSIVNMGKSVEGLDILGVRLSHNAQNKAIFIESGIHAREWIAPATALYIINELLNSVDPKVQQLARSYNWYIFPCVNPDGYKYSFQDRMWRKNRSLFGICRGVDLNRNFPFHWNTTGTSGDPCRYDYSGPAAGSESETQSIMNYVRELSLKEQIRAYIALHSYSQLIMFPYGYTADHVNNYNDLTDIGNKAAAKIKEISGRIYKSGSLHETIYPSSGGSKDWAHGEMNISLTYTFELRGPPDSEDSFILPAAEIQPTAEEAFAAIGTIVEESQKRGYFN